MNTPTAPPFNMSPWFMSTIELLQIILVTVTFPFYIFLLAFIISAQLRNIDDLATPFFKLCISSSFIDLSGFQGRFQS